jgi:hypothetical protein
MPMKGSRHSYRDTVRWTERCICMYASAKGIYAYIQIRNREGDRTEADKWH